MKKWLWLLAISVLLIGSLMMIGNYTVYSEIRNSPEYILGMDALRSSPKARELLGDRLNANGGNPKENAYTVGGNGSGELNIPVSGTIHKGTLYIKATEKSGQWHIDELALRLDGQSNWNELLPSVSR